MTAATASQFIQKASAAGIARTILEPLCEETAKLLAAVRIQPNDRLYIELDKDGKHFIIQTHALLNGQQVQASWEGRYKWIDNVPEHKNLNNGQFSLGATDITALVINASWPRDQIIGDEDALSTYDFLLTRFLKQTIASQHRALFKLKGKMPPLPDDWHDHPDKPLAPYQIVGTVGMLGQQGAAAFCEQGTGKTPLTIRDICIESQRWGISERAAAKEEGRKRRLFTTLVVCPKNVRANWAREVAEFATVPGKVVVLRGGAVERMRLLLEAITSDDEDSEFAIVVCSYEAVEKSWESISLIKWNMAVADESHYMKNPYAKRQQRMMDLRDCCMSTRCLTGTPVTNTLLDLYGQLEFLGEGMSGFSSWKKFKNFYGKFEKEGNRQRETLIGYQNLPFLQERLARVAFMITKAEALPYLPPKTYDTREVEMTAQQREWYVKMMNRIALEIEDGKNEDGKTMTAQHILTKLLRLAQITSGFVKWDAQVDPDTGDVKNPGEVEFLQDRPPKVTALLELIRSTKDDEKVIVWACFVPDILKIDQILTEENIPHGTYYGGTSDKDREKLEREFNGLHAREMKVFIGNAAAGGTGLNLRGYDPDAVGKETGDHRCDCTHVVYYSQNWSMVYRNQSEDRAHRRGTRRNVQYTDLVVPNTIDEEIRVRVMNKTVNALTIQDVRDIMRRVLDTLPEEEE